MFTINTTDSIFEVDVDMLVNPVNCKGVSGKGLALEFARRFPLAQRQYIDVCKKEVMAEDVRGVTRKIAAFLPGDVYHTIDMNVERIPTNLTELSPEAIDELLTRRQHVVFFPTKNHWKNPSKYEYIEKGLKSLRTILSRQDDVKSIAIPALGCGLGGLAWDKVEELITQELAEVDKEFVLFPPQ